MVYALGEIFLVVIGIFMGLQANKWNEINLKHDKVLNYLTRIDAELNLTEQLIEHNMDVGYHIIEDLSSCLSQIAENRIDSTFAVKFKTISENDAQTLFFPVVDEFLNQGYLTAIKDTLMLESFNLLNYNRQQSQVDDQQFVNFHNQIVMPKLMNKLNYLQVDYMNFESERFKLKELNFTNFRHNDYTKIAQDLEIWNLVIYRIDLEKNRILVNKNLLGSMSKIQKRIALSH